MTIPCANEYFRIKGTLWEGRTLYDLYREAHTPREWHAPLKALAEELGLVCFSTPFDAGAVDFLETLGMPMHKVASFELVDVPLLKKVAATRKPVILSTGMATVGEIAQAVDVLREHGCGELSLLKCTSAYPAPPEEANLRTLPHLAELFACPVGLSDHTLGSAVAVAAVALDARIIEKHFTLSRADGGPDGAFSMEPHEFKQMAGDIRTAEKALGRVSYGRTPGEEASAVFRRSLFAVEDVKAGEAFTPRNVRSIRPGHGLPPRHYDAVMGKAARVDVARGTPLGWEVIG
jgi:pseudaminic acid synthase